MSLANWLGNGWLTEHRTSPQEMYELAKSLYEQARNWLNTDPADLLMHPI